jgi:hypothetical protein
MTFYEKNYREIALWNLCFLIPIVIQMNQNNSQHYQDDNMVEPIWKYIKKYKHSFKAYEKLRSVVNEFRTLRIEPSEDFKRLIDNECSVRHSSSDEEIMDEDESGFIVHDEEIVSSRAFYWRVNHNFY